MPAPDSTRRGSIDQTLRMTTLRFLLILLLVLNALAFAAVQGWLSGATPRGEAERLGNQLNPERIQLATDTAAVPATPTTSAPAAGAAESAEAAPAVEPAEPTETTEPTEPTELTGAPRVATAGASPASSASAGAEHPAASAPTEPPPSAPAMPDGATAGAPSPHPDASPAAPTADAPSPTVATAEPPPAVPPAQECFAWAGLAAADAEQLSQQLRRAGFAPARSRVDTPNSWWVRVPPQASREQAERRVQELRQLGITDTYIVPDAGPTQFAISLGVFKTEPRARQLLNQLREKGVRNAGVEPRLTTTYRVQASLPADRLRAVEAAQRGLRARRTACARGG